ncbi:hypothetical protein TNCV_3579251 [Trichonephila clavipes]|nr:hypothetical protein TNCV_3579251 [Trichonephila clavipes]
MGHCLFQKRSCILPSCLGANKGFANTEDCYVESTLILQSPFLSQHSVTTIYRKETHVNNIHCWLASHLWIAIYLKEKECRFVVIKTYPQYQSDREIYSYPDGMLGTATEGFQTCQPIVSKHQWIGTKARRACADPLRSPIRDYWERERGMCRGFKGTACKSTETF